MSLSRESLKHQKEVLADDRLSRLQRADAWRVFFSVVVIVGGGIAAITQLIPSNFIVPSSNWVGIFGAVLAILAGVVVAFTERDGPSMMERAQIAIDSAQELIAERENISKLIDQLYGADEKNRSIQTALRFILDYIDELNSSQGEDIKENLRNMFRSVLREIEISIGVTNKEQWTITVFMRNSENSLMVPLVKWRANRGEEDEPTRSWAKGSGYTGLAWANRTEIVLADTSSPTALALLKDIAPRDPELYVSVIAVPIKPSFDNDVWGVLTVTSDLKGRFSELANSGSAQSVENVKLLGAALSLFAILSKPKTATL